MEERAAGDRRKRLTGDNRLSPSAMDPNRRPAHQRLVEAACEPLIGSLQLGQRAFREDDPPAVGGSRRVALEDSDLVVAALADEEEK